MSAVWGNGRARPGSGFIPTTEPVWLVPDVVCQEFPIRICKEGIFSGKGISISLPARRAGRVSDNRSGCPAPLLLRVEQQANQCRREKGIFSLTVRGDR